ncbi:hypothetical protein M0R45_007033 [Rubus argutus]|uniref:Uncharacterized protein n=1 Tax=Rubus argutus TaxID=59490 RepID=A0AAW1YTM2_RUBAR
MHSMKEWLHSYRVLWTVSRPYGFGAAASTRDSNELGAGNPKGARIATCAAMFPAARILQGVLLGIARGCGWQHTGAYINLGAIYLCGIPVAATLAFLVQLRGRGHWIGIQVGAFVQTPLLAFVTTCTNWEKQASKARERIFGGSSPVNNGLCH